MAQLPEITPTAMNAFFWDGADAGRLMIQRCGRCARFQHPPAPACTACGGRDLTAEAVSGKGRIDTFTHVHRAFHPGFADRLPYAVARIELAEQQDLFVIANVVDTPVDAVRIGAPVTVRFEQRGDRTLPQFAVESAA